jgi:hypothetical protein
MTDIQRVCDELGVEPKVEIMEGGIKCPDNNPHLATLLAAVNEATRTPARIGKKKPGTSARFAPGGNAVVWGQSGIGPHARDERHFIPSIGPYLDILDVFADSLMKR